jgi:hypothetical protein
VYNYEIGSNKRIMDAERIEIDSMLNAYVIKNCKVMTLE